MSRIRSANTKPEMLVRKFLFSRGFRYRLHDKRLPGKPDIILPKLKTVIFVHGCFWHGHKGCRYFVLPKTRSDWWKAKILKNQSNDHKNMTLLRQAHWKVISIFECSLKPKKREKSLINLVKSLENQ